MIYWYSHIQYGFTKLIYRSYPVTIRELGSKESINIYGAFRICRLWCRVLFNLLLRTTQRGRWCQLRNCNVGIDCGFRSSVIVLVKCRWKEISQKNTSVIEIREAGRVTLFSNDIIPEFCDIRVIRIILNRNNNHYGC